MTSAAGSVTAWRGADFDPKIGMAHRFSVTIGRFPLGGWSKVAGIAFDCKPQAISQAGFNTYTAQLLTVPTWSPIVLSRVVIAEEWASTYAYLMHAFTTPESPSFDKMGKSADILSIDICNAWGDSIRRLWFYNARPSKWSVSDLDASKAAPAIEQLTLSHDGFFPDGSFEPSV